MAGSDRIRCALRDVKYLRCLGHIGADGYRIGEEFGLIVVKGADHDNAKMAPTAAVIVAQ